MNNPLLHCMIPIYWDLVFFDLKRVWGYFFQGDMDCCYRCCFGFASSVSSGLTWLGCGVNCRLCSKDKAANPKLSRVEV